MTDHASFDPNAWFAAYRSAYAPLLQAQRESLKLIERVARYQYAVAGDYLESGLSRAEATLAVKSPAEFFSKQLEISTRLGEQLRGRAQELVGIATEAQSAFSQVFSEATAKAAGAAKSAEHAKAAEHGKKAA